MIKKEGRYLWADILRIIAIYLVISVHLSFLPRYITFAGLPFFIHFAIAKTSVPLFVMLSGALLLPKVESYKDFYSKRLRRLLLPWILWSIVFLVINKQEFTLQNFSTAIQSYWFLPMIVGLYLLTPAIRLFVKSASVIDIGLIIFIWFIAVSFIPYVHPSKAFPFSVDNGLVRQVFNFFGYYLLGFFLTKIRLSNNKHFYIAISLFFIGIFIILISLFSKGGVTQEHIYNFEYNSPGIVLMSIGIFVLFIKYVGKFEKKISENYKRLCQRISSATLGVFFIHGFIWPFLQNYMLLGNYPIQNMLVSIFLLFTISLLVVMLLQKIPYVGKIII